MQVGSIVECIFNFEQPSLAQAMGLPPVILPVKGKQYTVRDIDKYPLPIPGRSGYFIRLEEIINDLQPGEKIEPAFLIEGFREFMPPVQDVEAWVNENATPELVPA